MKSGNCHSFFGVGQRIVRILRRYECVARRCAKVFILSYVDFLLREVRRMRRINAIARRCASLGEGILINAYFEHVDTLTFNQYCKPIVLFFCMCV